MSEVGALTRPVVLVSNRGPVGFTADAEGRLHARRGAGGLVSGLTPVVAEHGITWIAAAMSDGDRIAATRGVIDADGLPVQLLDIAEDTYRQAYDTVCNATLWFWHHHLFDLVHTPVFDRRWRTAWDAYREVNRHFADAVAEAAPEGAAVLVQDYHLALLGSMLHERRPDVHAVHFSHTPFVAPELVSVLPDDVVRDLLHGMAGHHSCGFHTRRWADAYMGCIDVGLAPYEPRSGCFVSPLAPDVDGVRATAASPACAAARAQLDELVGDRKFLVRVDRVEPSKNLLRGFAAFGSLLDEHPWWRGRAVFGAFVYPSREGLPEYVALREEMHQRVAEINERHGTDDWTPILLDESDDYVRSIAALSRADVVLVNSTRDGLNLVAFEAGLVNDVDGVLALSPETGAWDLLGPAALRVHPFEVTGTAVVLAEALAMEPDERRMRAERWHLAAAARRPADWLADQLRAAG